jgi:hypothetical protein
MPEPRLLVAIITGGRPALDSRPTRQYVETLRAAGFSEVEWVIRSDHASAYERDDLPLNVYPVEWASDYARAHWRHPTAVWEAGGFFGAFPGREWAMRSAEERGYDAVLQMDDNVITIGLLNSSLVGYRAALPAGDLLRILADFCLSTNARMCGAQLNSVMPTGLVQTIRPGYPYSVFVERCGPGRMPYHGPFEDDIMHALEYARNGGPNRTAAVVDTIRYNKEHRVRTGGMRSAYDATRGLEIARRYPENARIGMGRKSSSPRDTDRGVRHFLTTKGFTPVRVTDLDVFSAADARLRDGLARAAELQREQDREKITRRAAGARK